MLVLLSILSGDAAILTCWSQYSCSDSFAGYSEGAVVSYVLSLARKAGGVDALASVLHSQASTAPSARPFQGCQASAVAWHECGSQPSSIRLEEMALQRCSLAGHARSSYLSCIARSPICHRTVHCPVRRFTVEASAPTLPVPALRRCKQMAQGKLPLQTSSSAPLLISAAYLPAAACITGVLQT